MDLKENKKIRNFRDTIYTSGIFILLATKIVLELCLIFKTPLNQITLCQTSVSQPKQHAKLKLPYDGVINKFMFNKGYLAILHSATLKSFIRGQKVIGWYICQKNVFVKKILTDKLNLQSIYKRPRPAQNLPTPSVGCE
jgi:hypothetical protein